MPTQTEVEALERDGHRDHRFVYQRLTHARPAATQFRLRSRLGGILKRALHEPLVHFL